MKKISFLVIFAFICLSAFADTGTQEEVDFLLFLPNSGSQFADEGQAMVHLDNVASYLMGRNPGFGQIHVAGYTAVAVNDIDSMALSMERALFVIHELQNRGLPRELFADPVAYGEVDLWGSNADENERSPNRRAIILIDGQVLTPVAMAPVESYVEPAREEPVTDRSGSRFPWWLLLLLLPLLFLALKSRKKKEEPKPAPAVAVSDPVSVSQSPVAPPPPITITYSYVNLEEEIRFRAYEFFLERKGQSINMYEDWCKAVIVICAKYGAEGFETYTEDGTWWARRANRD